MLAFGLGRLRVCSDSPLVVVVVAVAAGLAGGAVVVVVVAAGLAGGAVAAVALRQLENLLRCQPSPRGVRASNQKLLLQLQLRVGHLHQLVRHNLQLHHTELRERGLLLRKSPSS